MRVSRSALVFLASALSCDSVAAQEGGPRAIEPRAVGGVERLHPDLDRLVPADARVEAVADGFVWSEGPVWLPEIGVVFSDVPRNTVYSWSEAKGLSVYLRPSGYTGRVPHSGESGSNGLALDRRGRLLLCQHGDRRLARMDTPLDAPRAEFVTLVATHDCKRFNSPNDLAVHSSGAVFFTDPPYGLPKQTRDEARELDFQGVYRLDPDGTLALLVDDLPRPNGVALSPDEKTLYVAQSHETAKIYMAYDLDDRLGVLGGRVLFDANELGKTRPGNPDGLKLDHHGNLFATGPGGVLVLSPRGRHLGTITTGERVANCAFGEDGRTLYMTSDRYLCRVRLPTKGVGF